VYKLLPAFEDVHLQLIGAMIACRDRSRPTTVHKLRTTVRRLEAVLRCALEEHPKAARLCEAIAKAHRKLARVRKASGAVRDIDVQRNLASGFADQFEGRARAKNAEVIRKENDFLQHRLKRRRKKAERELRQILTILELRTERSLEGVAKELSELTASGFSPLVLAQRWTKEAYTRNEEICRDKFHELRKQTKSARYIAELQPESKAAAGLARRLHGIQSVIGYWHDLELLTQEAVESLGRHALLSEGIERTRQKALKDVERLLKSQ
jgi:CHAD domain-containing protein